MLKTTKHNQSQKHDVLSPSFYSSKGGLLSPCEHGLLSLLLPPQGVPPHPHTHLKVQKTMGLPSPYHPNSNFPLLIPGFIHLWNKWKRSIAKELFQFFINVLFWVFQDCL
jgi:hypothetical protein